MLNKYKGRAWYQKSRDLRHNCVMLRSQMVGLKLELFWAIYPFTPDIYFMPLWSLQWLYFDLVYVIKPYLTPVVRNCTLKSLTLSPPMFNFHVSYDDILHTTDQPFPLFSCTVEKGWGGLRTRLLCTCVLFWTWECGRYIYSWPDNGSSTVVANFGDVCTANVHIGIRKYR